MFAGKFESGKSAVQVLRLVGARNFAASASAQPQRVPPTERPFLPTPEGLKFTRLSSGLFLATVDNRNPVSRISLIFKAGTRYETTDTRGIVHRIRNLVGLSTNRRTSVDFNHYLATIGAVLSSTATRDHLSIDIQVSRNHANTALFLLNELVGGDTFHVQDHELHHSTDQMWYEKNQLKEDLAAYSFEKLHKIAYRRQGLAYSLLAPKYAIGKHHAKDVQDFAHRHLVTGNAALVATGVDHGDVLKFASDKFFLAKGPAVQSPSQTKFYSGDVRKERPKTDFAYVHIASPAAGLTDVKGTIAYAVLAHLLGTGPVTKWNDGGQSRLARAVRKAVQNPTHVTTNNYGYEDTGIFSLFYVAHWEDSAAVAKALVGEVRSVANDVNDKDLQAAKNRLKYRLLTSAENDDGVAEDLAVQAIVRQADIHLAADQAKLVDSISTADIQKAAKQLVSSKFVISSIGRLDKTPYLDELIA